jgi:hypothetical protein
VKSIAGILLISIYLLSFAEFHNLLRIPVLVEHFKEHRQLDVEISFWSFIKLHYIDPLVVDDDYQRDNQLPFRDTDCCPVTSANVCECFLIAVEIQPPVELPRRFHPYKEIKEPRFTAFDIFQPPRSA